MGNPCDDALIWIDAGANVPDTDLAAHMGNCPTCRARLETYRRLVDLGRERTATPAPDVPSFEGILDRLDGVRRLESPFPGGRLVLAITAVAGVAVLAWLMLPGLPVQGGMDAGGLPCVSSGGPPGAEPGGPYLADTEGVEVDGQALAACAGTVALHAGQVIQTAATATRIVDRATATLVLTPSTRLELQDWDGRTTRLRLEAGRVDCDVLHRSAGQTFEVVTAWGSVQVVGTRFAVTRQVEGAMDVEVFEGRVSVRTPSGAEVASVGSGEAFRLGPNRPTQAGILARHPPAPSRDRPATEAIAPVTDRPREAGPREPASTLHKPTASPAGKGAGIAAETAAQANSGPRNASLSTDEVRRLLSMGQTAAAVAEISRALAAVSPEVRPRFLALLGDAHRLEGRFEQARGAYELALDEGGAAAPEGIYPDLASLLQQDLARPDQSVRVWRRYLDTHPSGRYSSRALWAVASLAIDGHRAPDATDLMHRIVTTFPRAPEAVPAFVEIGRGLLEAGDLEGAETWFGSRLDGPARPVAEAALVGLMRCAYQRQDRGRVRDLASRHEREFPGGSRREEVRRLLDGMGKEVAPLDNGAGH